MYIGQFKTFKYLNVEALVISDTSFQKLLENLDIQRLLFKLAL